MKAWLGDMFRMGWALGYWNARKTLFVLRRRRGQCPCHNPSDSGRPMETGCEAVLHWQRPGRFRRVCPLLVRNPKGSWVCRVAAGEVRPFWGRALGFASGAVLAAALLAGGGVLITMRAIGYQVTPRQIFWPPAWRELRAVRVRLFVDQARAHFQAGRMREALTALLTAHEVAPDDYPVAMTLAQVMQVANPAASDSIYLQMLQQHPEKRAETAQVWFMSLLTRGRLADVAELARRQLAADPGQAAAWTHALIFVARQLGQPGLLDAAASASGVPAPVAAVLRLEAKVRRTLRMQVPALLLAEPVPADFPYAWAQRAGLLIEFGHPREALGVLARSRSILGGRDVVRLALAAYAAAGDTATLDREAGSLLAPARNPGLDEITLLSQHLIKYPNNTLLHQLAALLEGSPNLSNEHKREAWLNVLCAAGAAGDRAEFDQLKAKAEAQGILNSAGVDRLQDFFFGGKPGRRVQSILQMMGQLSVDLTYTLLDRYWKPEAVQPGG